MTPDEKEVLRRLADTRPDPASVKRVADWASGKIVRPY